MKSRFEYQKRFVFTRFSELFLMQSDNIGIIFDKLTILWCHFKRNRKSFERNGKIFWTRNAVILWHQSLCCDVVIGSSCQYCCNAVYIKVGIHISICFAMETYIVFSRFSLKCFTKEAVIASFVEHLQLGQYGNKKM